MKTRWARRGGSACRAFLCAVLGHAFIGYADCVRTPDGVAAVLSNLHEFAVIAYLYAAGPLMLLLLGVEVINRKRNRA